MNIYEVQAAVRLGAMVWLLEKEAPDAPLRYIKQVKGRPIIWSTESGIVHNFELNYTEAKDYARLCNRFFTSLDKDELIQIRRNARATV